MLKVLFGYGMRVFDAVVILAAIVAGVACAYHLFHRRWQAERRELEAALAAKEARLEALRRELADARRRWDPARLKAMREDLQSAVAHEFVKGLNSMLQKSTDTLDGLRPDQIELRDRQAQVIAQGYDLLQRAQNIVGLFGLPREVLERELVNPRGLLEGVLKELFPYAEAQGVVLRPALASVEPIQANRHLVAQVFSNLVHNAIKYSPRGAVVDVELRLEQGGEKRLCVEVRDRGRGIPEADQESIFALRTRGDGLVEPGSGLGLYYARELSRLHGGDLVLVESRPNQGSTFRVTLPCQ